MAAIRITSLYEALKAEGFDLPDECADIELLLPVDGLPVLQYQVCLHSEQLERFGRALARMGRAQSGEEE